MSYRCAIVDDEPLAVELLSNYLGNIDRVELIMSTDKLQDVEQLISENMVDLILLDVNLKGVKRDSINLLLRKKNCHFIIVTAYPLSYIKDIAIGADHGYLVKPVSFIRFQQEVQKMLGI